jgi:hypothetical protein
MTNAPILIDTFGQKLENWRTLSYFRSLFCDLNTAGGTKRLLDITLDNLSAANFSSKQVREATYVDSELEGSQRANHEQPRTNAGERSAETKLPANLDQTAGSTLTREALGLVDLAKHGIGRLRDDSGRETSHQTGAQVDDGLHAVAHVLLGVLPVDGLGDLLVDDELGHGVGDLLEQDRAEPSIEGTDAFRAQDLAEAANKPVGVGRLGDETDARGFQRAERDVGEELAERRGRQVDARAVVARVLHAQLIDELRLEELVAAKLEGALQEVAGGGRAKACQQRAGTLICDHLAEATDHAAVVGCWVQLNAGLDAVQANVLASAS